MNRTTLKEEIDLPTIYNWTLIIKIWRPNINEIFVPCLHVKLLSKNIINTGVTGLVSSI